MIDTPGLDDEGELGVLRIKKTYQMLNKTDIALLIVDGTVGLTMDDLQILEMIEKKSIPYVIVYNKLDLVEQKALGNEKDCIWVSASTGENIQELKELLARLRITDDDSKKLVSDLLEPLDFVILVVPIDSAAPKGRLILPQQQTIRDILEAGATAMVVKDTELAETLTKLGGKPKLVITDSQVFEKVAQVVPEDVLLTSFSILMARYKGDLETVVYGVSALDKLQDGDTVLISEACTHHRQCEDIGTVKIPCWVREYTQKEIRFVFTSGTEFPDDLSQYKMVIHCGGCMLNGREMKYRMKCAQDQQVPIANYGMVIAHMKGILSRSLKVFDNA